MKDDIRTFVDKVTGLTPDHPLYADVVKVVAARQAQ